MNKDDINFWKWAIVTFGTLICGVLSILGLVLVIPGAVLIISAISVATKLEDLDDGHRSPDSLFPLP
jgi:quinol-cytochrome oxidoreductase complex cytochrome b subunit